MNSKIKNLRITDRRQAKNLLWNEWNLWSKESWAPKNLCSWIYFVEILEKTEQLIAYKEKWKLIWFWWYGNYKSKKLKKRFFWISLQRYVFYAFVVPFVVIFLAFYSGTFSVMLTVKRSSRKKQMSESCL